ncbi:hypothetical protein BVX97_01920 [bacterium E08(2017)]|nr:hypothetical protein BVX97_01920 [bacterium E08(2017)]
MNIAHRSKAWVAVTLLVLIVGAAGAQGVLNPDQIDGLKTRWFDAKRKKKILFKGGFEQRALNPEKYGKHKSLVQTYKRTGRVPCRISVTFGSITEFKSGQTSPELYTGDMVHYYITDFKGNVVVKSRATVGKLHKQKNRTGGIYQDLPRPGTYTCVLYVKKSGMLFGEEITAEFTGYK